MKIVGIITLNGYKNYGNRLQNYALQEVIKSIGYEVETILIDDSTISSRQVKRSFSFVELPKKVLRRLVNLKNNKHTNIRTEKFKDFSRNYIVETNYKISEANIETKNLSQYKYLVTGSDQVWNPFYIHGSPLYFLSFVPKEKRISYAASFGIANIPQEYQMDYKKYLNEMQSLAVREEQGASIIKKLTGRDAKVVVDPTMLLTKDEWSKVAKEANTKPKKPYLLTYFLGEVSSETRNRIDRLAKKKNLKIINMANFKDIEYYTADPSEFLDFIKSAEIFCTDSFHGVVFSILFEKPFIVFERKGRIPSMNSRVETLLSKFSLESRMDRNIKDLDKVFDIDFSHVEKLLQHERNEALTYLRDALK